jgi:hypothetical protein
VFPCLVFEANLVASSPLAISGKQSSTI